MRTLSPLTPPSINDLLDAHRSWANIDTAWLSPEILRALNDDLRKSAGRALKARSLATYDKMIDAAEAATFTLHLLERSRARERRDL
jgi:hypothetical protein